MHIKRTPHTHTHHTPTTSTPHAHAHHTHFTCTGITITNSELTTVVVNSELGIVMPVLYTVL